ncbi:ABC transporter permease (plasmid) [Aminobacter sp. BA135]|uniref:ABC transporter permease n=1 Tax=Aminobacter sp. BA135 TaxID=537596 RepID=UPI003D7BBBDC
MSKSTNMFLLPLALVAATLILFALPQTHDTVSGFFSGAFGGRNHFNFFTTLGRFAILLGLAMSVLVSFRAGLVNIGAEGQMVLGGLVAALVGVYLPGPPLVVAIAALLAAMTVAALWAMLAGFLDRAFKVPLLIGTLLLNYPASFIASYCVSHPFRDVASGTTQSYPILAEARLPRFTGTLLDYGFILIGVTALLVILFERSSVFGYRTRMQGFSFAFAQASGYPTRRLFYRTLMLSGALAGMVGFVVVFGMTQRYVDGMLTVPLYAWTGIAAVLLAAVIPSLVPMAAFVFAVLATGAIGMERAADIPREAGQVVQAVIMLFLAGYAGQLMSGAKGREH